MKKFLVSLLVSLALLSGCSEEAVKTPVEMSAFIEELKANGVEGSLLIRAPFNEDMEYVAEYAIAKYTSTRIISVFKFKDAEKAEANLQEALKNDKLSGQASNGTFVMAATFYPPDEEAVEKIKALFLAHEFE
jgi:predicted TIM-barrel fold metal-dependent hydrolase